MSININKKISKNGSITIPAHVRRSLGIAPGDRFQIESDTNGRLSLKRTKGSCVFCESSDGKLREFKGRLLCSTCKTQLDEIKEE